MLVPVGEGKVQVPLGRLADGWLASFSMPDECAAGRATIEEVAAEHGRTIDPEHFGAMIIYSPGPLPDAVVELVRAHVEPGNAVIHGIARTEDQDRLVEPGLAPGPQQSQTAAIGQTQIHQ